ncbi:unnamed protein product [Tuber melanosporum]|uniref:(Perigord truffle) hypothetical protein n=1 Tax=Tuber melanosporum (strain Mel28) TaxID=656061 RepID=D5G4E1_TUBMM|nr:uncharacterized protein GSTUM_00004067001 [Tuber melanosporum]CAZ79384.1 unnamed protein product [Tuber melanosporum]
MENRLFILSGEGYVRQAFLSAQSCCDSLIREIGELFFFFAFSGTRFEAHYAV